MFSLTVVSLPDFMMEVPRRMRNSKYKSLPRDINDMLSIYTLIIIAFHVVNLLIKYLKYFFSFAELVKLLIYILQLLRILIIHLNYELFK